MSTEDRDLIVAALIVGVESLAMEAQMGLVNQGSEDAWKESVKLVRDAVDIAAALKVDE